MPSEQQPIPSPVSIGLDGGLNLKTDPQRLQPPSVTRADNVWHVQPGNVQQLPGFVSQLGQAAGASHFYNLAIRDLSPPAPAGDLLVHGEYPDNKVSGFTRSLWATNNGFNVTQNQSSLPFVARVRSLALVHAQGSTSPSSYPTLATYCTQLASARETGAARPRFALASSSQYLNGGASLTLQTGYVDSSTKIASTSILDAGNPVVVTAYDAGELQGTSQFVAFYNLQSGGAQFSLHDYALTSQTGPTTAGTAVSSTQTPLVCVAQHAGRTLLGWINNGTGFSPQIRDVLQGSTYSFGAITGSAAPVNFAIGSPYTHQTSANVTFFALVYDRKLFVVARTGTGGFNQVGSVTLPAISGAITTSTTTPLATVAVNILDNQGGVGNSATLGITVFTQQTHADYDQNTSALATYNGRNFTYQYVTAHNYRFVAAASSAQTTAGTLTSLGNFIRRAPGGVGIASKAFCMVPPETQYSGPAAAKQALCLVQTSALEPEVQQVYNPLVGTANTVCRDAEPTYHLINHRCEIVGRFAEGAAATRGGAEFCWAGTGATPAAAATFPKVRCLAGPIFSSGTPDDTSLYSISIPTWVNTVAPAYGTFVGTDLTPYASVGLSSYVASPSLVTLSMDRNAQSCVPISTGAHVYPNGLLGQIHDGEQLIEQNYHARPPPPVFLSNTGAALAGSKAGYYRLYVVWTWVDAQGFVHRSAPSISSICPQTAENVLTGVTMALAIGSTTQKGVIAEVYISPSVNADGAVLLGTVALGALAIFNQLTPTSGPQDFDYIFYRNWGTVTFSYSYTNTPTNRSMYTQASATSSPTYASNPPRNAISQISGKGRAFALAQITGQHRLYYSSVATQSFPFEWNDFNYAPVPPEIGDARSLEIIDDKVIVLGTRGNAALSGDGPPPGNTVGVPAPGDGFSPVTPIPTPAGVLGTGSPTRVPEGVVFTGYSGIQLIGRDLNIQPIGMGVDLLTGRQVGNLGTIYGRAVTLPSLQSVVYPNPRGPALVYSYLTKRWSTWPLLSNALTLAQRMDGTLYALVQPIGTRQLAVTYSGADLGSLSTTALAYATGTTTAPGLIVETPWIAVGGVTGCEADLYEAEVIGTWLGPHTLYIEQAYNYRDYALGQTTSMATSPGEYMVRVRPLQNTRVWAVRYRITLQPVTTLDAGYPMADLADLVVYSMPQGGTAQVDSARTR